MHPVKLKSLLQVLDAQGLDYEEKFRLKVNKKIWDLKAKELLAGAYRVLEGLDEPVYLEELKFDFKIDRFLFLYDGESHFNRYRSNTLKSAIYQVFTFPWADTYRRLCRTYERDCLKSGMQQRVWEGPPLAQRCFGKAGEAGDLSGNGAPGWKLNAYNDVQYDLVSRLAAYKIIRIPMYENIMVSGSLKSIDQMLHRPQEESKKAITNWLKRKML